MGQKLADALALLTAEQEDGINFNERLHIAEERGEAWKTVRKFVNQRTVYDCIVTRTKFRLTLMDRLLLLFLWRPLSVHMRVYTEFQPGMVRGADEHAWATRWRWPWQPTGATAEIVKDER